MICVRTYVDASLERGKEVGSCVQSVGCFHHGRHLREVAPTIVPSCVAVRLVGSVEGWPRRLLNVPKRYPEEVEPG